MENFEKPKPPQEIEPKKIEKIAAIVEQPIPQQESTEVQEQHKADRAEADAKALQKVREELGISKSKESVDGDDKEIDDEFNTVSVSLDEFESDFRKNKFKPLSFNSDGLRKTHIDGKFDPKRASEEIQQVTRAFKRGFLSEDFEERMSIETHNFNNVIDSIDGLSARFSNLRKTIEKHKKTPENETGYKILEKTISDSITAMRIKKEELDEANLALRRYRGR